MLKTKQVINSKTGKSRGFMFWTEPDAPQEPTLETLTWLHSIATGRATGQKMLVGKLGDLWIEIIGYGDLLGTYTVRQLPDGNPPAFYSPLTQQKNHYSADIHAATLRAELECLFNCHQNPLIHEFQSGWDDAGTNDFTDGRGRVID